jgi:hypothetical protein
VKKVLIGLGIGCGALMLVGVAMLVVGGMWVKGKVEGAAEEFKAIEEQQNQIAELDRKFKFDKPKQGEPLKLTEKRVEQYLAVRASLQPVFKGFEDRAKGLEKKGDKDIGAAFQAVGMVSELVKQVRATFLEQLDRQRMSPAEFHAITGAIYSSWLAKGMAEMRKGSKEAMAQLRAQLTEQLENPELSDEHKEALLAQLEASETQLAQLPDSPAGEGVMLANATLLEKYKERIEKEANPALDAFLLGGDGDMFGGAFDNAAFKAKAE